MTTSPLSLSLSLSFIGKVNRPDTEGLLPAATAAPKMVTAILLGGLCSRAARKGPKGTLIHPLGSGVGTMAWESSVT